ncbi:hypothetical protein COLO4_36243 [Corchorus olitorius]|uniref:Uncharacterized protein n=1 Tax=Corchorus olitorius TaxID=93759 RepID=A0A1R3GAD4_9ROSI|nr:hypothetical protein COLO4_36243 [Corchorus olitorius]
MIKDAQLHYEAMCAELKRNHNLAAKDELDKLKKRDLVFFAMTCVPMTLALVELAFVQSSRFYLNGAAVFSHKKSYRIWNHNLAAKDELDKLKKRDPVFFTLSPEVQAATFIRERAFSFVVMFAQL